MRNLVDSRGRQAGPTAFKRVRPLPRQLLIAPLVLLAGLMLAQMMVMSLARAAGDPAAGEQKAYTCLGCHGVKHYVNTYPTYKVPRIAGQHEEYLVAALKAYRAQTRAHATMQANAGLLSDQDIADIAAWFAAQGASSP